MNASRDLYAAMGARPVINALGNRTMLGGSNPAPEVIKAMQLSARYYVDMVELFEGTGKVIADLLDCEAALVTPGCAAALVLGTAACMTGTDRKKMGQLPDVTGIKNEVIIQQAQRYKYDRVVRIPGTSMVECGDGDGTSTDELAAAFGSQTVAVLYPVIENSADLVSLQDTISIAHDHGVPVIVDAAYRVYPLDGFRQYVDWGADLVGYGAKYFGAPNSAGVLCGRADLIEAARFHSFASFEKFEVPGIGRPLKIDRQEVVGVVVALQQWLEMDHGKRHAQAASRSRNLRDALQNIKGVELPSDGSDESMATLVLQLDEQALGKTAFEIDEELRGGDPSIWTDPGSGVIRFFMFTVEDGDEDIIAQRLKEVIG